MPPKKSKAIGQVQPKAKRIKLLRAAETSEKQQQRLARNRERALTSRASETPLVREARLQDIRERATMSRLSETEQQREARLQDMRQRATMSRVSETQQQRQVRLRDKRDTVRTSRAAAHLSLMLGAFHYDRHTDYMQHLSVTIGRMDKLCTYCHAKKFKSEPSGMCCKNGKVKLPQLEPPPHDLLSYMSGATSESKHFLKNIRRYNSCFNMTSFGATAIVQQPGFPTFTVQGQVYHKAGSLLTVPEQSPKFLHLYFMGDEELEANQRCDYISGARREIVLNLQRMFHQHNHLIKTFKTALERMPTDEYKVVITADRIPAGEHERRFNAPQVHEVAVVISVEEFNQRDIIIQRRGDSLQHISETHRCYDALQYPVIFPRGEDAYHFNITQMNNVAIVYRCEARVLC